MNSSHVQQDFERWDLQWALFNEKFLSACAKFNKSPDLIQILPITKGAPAHAWEWVLKHERFRAVGESRLQEILEKEQLLGRLIPIEMIGHLQSNKVSKAVAVCKRIQSVDSQKLALKLQQVCEAQGRETLPILIEVNLTEEATKTGLSEADVAPLMDFIFDNCPSLKVEGWMTMGQKNMSPHNIFQKLCDIKSSMEVLYEINFPELSMGMSSDWPEAVECGSTLLRIGSALFR